MYQFRNDYSYGAPREVLDALLNCADTAYPGYGQDELCARAADMIRTLCRAPKAAVEFCMGGTQTNALAVSAFLRPWEGVISPVTGHINGHEVGAVEAGGNKILPVQTGPDGKLTPALLEPVVTAHQDLHLVKPALVYISQATETGTVYTKTELTSLSWFCRENGLKLFMDGARLGAALTSPACGGMTLPDVASLCDAFTIGGTKNGALLGEALVLCDKGVQKDFFRLKKQRGAVLAKGFLLGVQFEALLRDGLYWRLAAHANEQASRLQDGLLHLGIPLLNQSDTNQIFPIVPDGWLPALKEQVTFEVWGKADAGHTVVRFVTCFATRPEDVDGLLAVLSHLPREERS